MCGCTSMCTTMRIHACDPILSQKHICKQLKIYWGGEKTDNVCGLSVWRSQDNFFWNCSSPSYSVYVDARDQTQVARFTKKQQQKKSPLLFLLILFIYFFYFKLEILRQWDCSLVHWLRAPVDKPDHLSLIAKIHMVEREPTPANYLLTACCELWRYACIHTS